MRFTVSQDGDFVAKSIDWVEMRQAVSYSVRQYLSPPMSASHNPQ